MLIVYGDPDGTSNITGLTGGVSGRVITIVNGTENKVHIDHQGFGSSAGNTFEFNRLDGMTLGYAESATFFYNAVSPNQPPGQWYCMDERKERDSLHLTGTAAVALTGSQDDWALTVLLTKTFILVTPDGNYDITGLAASVFNNDGQVLGFVNVDTTYSITFKNASTSSAAGNRFDMGADFVLKPGASALFWYDTTNTCWRNLTRYLGGGTGDVVGAGSSTDHAAVRFDGTTGVSIQNSLVTIDDNGTVNIPSGQTYDIDGSPHTHLGSNIGTPTSKSRSCRSSSRTVTRNG